MKVGEAFEVISQEWQEQLAVVSLGTSTWEWQRLQRDSDRVWFHQPTMGLSGSVGLGLAVNLPQAGVWVLDGDGGLLMSFGALLAEAEHQPANMVHFLTSNRSYTTIGGYPLPNHAQTDYVGLAHSLGIRNAFSFSAVEPLREQLPGILAQHEYALVVLEVENARNDKPPVPWEGAELKFRFARHIERKFGVQIFNALGY